MGQRAATQTLFGIVAAFLERRTWSQAELARRLDTKPDTIRRRLGELIDAGFKLEREEDHPHVYWSVPKNWFPGALAFHEGEVADLLRLLARAPRGPLREKVLGAAVARLRNLGKTAKAPDTNGVRSPGVAENEEEILRVVEDAMNEKVVLRMRYYSASRREESWRHASVHRFEYVPKPHFVATCHRSHALRRFRLSNVLDAKLDAAQTFREVDADALARFDAESLGAFHADAAPVRCAFFVRDPEAAWVGRNLPDERIAQEPASGGARFSIETTATTQLARFVVGLGEAAKPETPELAAEVARLAAGALANAR
ncbi:MAG TPA: WYL domain-containing protein [Labilithrix sp.]